MGIIKKLIANSLERVGFGIGNNNSTGKGTVILKGFRPYPVIETPEGLDHEWEVGLYWYLKRIQGTDILDTGYMAHSGFTKILGKIGFNVTGVDLQRGELDNVTCIQSFVWDIPYPRESFDTILANSLLEHLGMDCYGQPQIDNAVNRTLIEFHRLLKKGSVFLLQVPYSKNHVLIKHNGQEFYSPWTRGDIDNIRRYFSIEEITYYARMKGEWVEVNGSVADKINQGGGFPSCLAYIQAAKYE